MDIKKDTTWFLDKVELYIPIATNVAARKTNPMYDPMTAPVSIFPVGAPN